MDRPFAKYVVHYRHDKYDVFIGRPSPYGNPFSIGKDGNREEVIEKFRKYAYSRPDFIQKIKKELKNKILGCHCSPLYCHGEILAEIANE